MEEPGYALEGEERSAARSSMEDSCGTSTVRQEEESKDGLQKGVVHEGGECGRGGARTRDPAVGGVLAVGHGADPAGVGLHDIILTLCALRAELPHLTAWACALAPEADSALCVEPLLVSRDPCQFS